MPTARGVKPIHMDRQQSGKKLQIASKRNYGNSVEDTCNTTLSVQTFVQPRMLLFMLRKRCSYLNWFLSSPTRYFFSPC